MRALDLSAIPQDDIRACEDIAAEAGVNLKDCYQCGKCTAGCPLADGMDLMPREVIRYLQLGAIDVVLEAKTPWICAQCVVCSSRCPQNVDICSTMRAVRLAAKRAGKRPLPEADIFDDEFIANVRAHGVSNEQYLAAAYNIKSGHFMQDMLNAPRMLMRGMIGVSMHNIEGKAEVAALVDRALAADAARYGKAAPNRVEGADDASTLAGETPAVESSTDSAPEAAEAPAAEAPAAAAAYAATVAAVADAAAAASAAAAAREGGDPR